MLNPYIVVCGLKYIFFQPEGNQAWFSSFLEKSLTIKTQFNLTEHIDYFLCKQRCENKEAGKENQEITCLCSNTMI